MSIETIVASPLIVGIATAVVGPGILLIMGSRLAEREHWRSGKLPADDAIRSLFAENSAALYAINDYKKRLALKAVYGFDFIAGQDALDNLVAYHKSGCSNYSLRGILNAFKDVNYKQWLQKAQQRRLWWKICHWGLAGLGWGILALGILLFLLAGADFWLHRSTLGEHWKSIVQFVGLGFLIVLEAAWIYRTSILYSIRNEYLQWAFEREKANGKDRQDAK